MTKRERIQSLVAPLVYKALQETYNISVEHPSDKQKALADSISEKLSCLIGSKVTVEDLEDIKNANAANSV